MLVIYYVHYSILYTALDSCPNIIVCINYTGVLVNYIIVVNYSGKL